MIMLGFEKGCQLHEAGRKEGQPLMAKKNRQQRNQQQQQFENEFAQELNLDQEQQGQQEQAQQAMHNAINRRDENC